MNPKVPGWIVELGDGTLLRDNYSTVIMFTEYVDAQTWAKKYPDAIPLPLVRFDRRGNRK